MTKNIQFIFGVHNHQPVGNFDTVFEEACEKSYYPFIKILEKHPRVAVSLHYSGSLLEWLIKRKPDFINTIQKLVRRGNVELISGGFYEPVLTAIPEKDRIGQIVKQNQFIRNHFGYEPRGLWLTERVWEPHLAGCIEQSGLNYTFIDEFNFMSTGIYEKPLKGYYNTEEDGHTLGIFPISYQLRSMIPWAEPEDIIDYLKSLLTDNSQDVVTVMDDGEKLGLYEGSYERVYEKGWLDRLMTLLEETPFITTKTVKEYWKSFPPKGLIYLPSCSYFDLGRQSLNCRVRQDFEKVLKSLEDIKYDDLARPFVKGGIWRNSLTKYPESNWLQKRMQQVSRKYYLLSSQYKRNDCLRKIREDLWKSMCNNGYWYNISGGLYLPHLRTALWTHLIRAEKEIDKRLYNQENHSFLREESDIDRNGFIEVSLSSRDLNAVFSAKYAGALVEFDYRPVNYNLCNTIARYKEYDCHPGDHDVYDTYPRHSLLERYFDLEINPRGLMNNAYEEASDFLNEPVDLRKDADSDTVVFARKGWINWQRCSLKKSIQMNENGFHTEYKISNIGFADNSFLFGPEFNLALNVGSPEDRFFEANQKLPNNGLENMLDENGIQFLRIVNKAIGIEVRFTFENPVRLLTYPVYTMLQKASGKEKIFQSTAILPLWNVRIEPGKTQKLSFSFSVKNL
ncbi:MAG: alpha-amylase/4-alpha-glucanotransferase domain-containing protein [Fidelibacterota bacterium]